MAVSLALESTRLVQHGLQDKHPPRFPSVIFTIARHTRRHKFFKSVNTIVDWEPLAKELDKIYTRGRNKAGKRAYLGILLFKMLLSRPSNKTILY